MRDGHVLDALYREVTSASEAQDFTRARAAYLAAVGLARDLDAPPTAPTTPPPAIRLIEWNKPRRIDLIALESGARDVAKFEDLSSDEARRVQAWAAARGLRSVVNGPYRKNFIVTVAQESPDSGLFAVIVSRGDRGERVAAAELDRSPEGTRRAGLALGYPPCCVDHFSSLPRDGLALRDGINEAAIRAIDGLRDGLPWEMNPLYQASPVGFTPCSAYCPHALAFARRLLEALQRVDPAGYDAVRTTLQRPVLFLRHALLFVLEGVSDDRGRVLYRRSIAADPRDRWLETWHHHELGCALAAGHALRLDRERLEIRSGDASIGWRVTDPDVPLLLTFS